MARHNEVGIELTARDLATKTIQRVGGTLDGLGGTVDTARSKFGLFGKVAGGLFNGVMLGAGIFAFGAITNSFGMLKGSIIDFNAQLEQAKIGFTQMLGSAEKADTFLRDLIQFANRTPFEVPGLITSAQMLLAFGFEASKVLPMMENIGNAAAGLGRGAEGVNLITRALGQMRAKGKVSGEEMLQLTEQGIPAWEILAKKMGLTIPELRKMVEKGLVPANEAVDMLVEGLGERFPDMMKQQAKTFTGAMSTIKDNVRNLLATAFKPLFDSLSQGAIAMADFLQSEKFHKWAADFAVGLERALAKVSAFAGWIANVISVIGDAGVASTEFMEIVNDLGESVAGVFEGLGKSIESFGSELAFAGNILGPIIRDFGGFVAAVANLVGTIFDAGINTQEFGEALGLLGERVKLLISSFLLLRERIMEAILDFVETALPRAIEAFEQFTEQLPALLSAMLPIVLDTIERMAEGFMAFVGRAIDIIHANAPAIIKAVSNFFQSLFDWIINVGVPQTAAAIGPLALKFIDWVFEVAPKVLDVLDDVIAAIVDFIIRNAPVLAGKLIEWALAFANWVITEVLPRLAANLPTILRAVLLFIGGFAGKIIGRIAQVGGQFVRTFIGKVAAMPGQLWQKFLQALGRLATFVGRLISNATSGARNTVSNFIAKIAALPGQLWAQFVAALGKLGQFITSLVARAMTGSLKFVQTVINNIRNLPGRFANFLSQVITKIIQWAKRLPGEAAKAAGNFVRSFMNGIANLPGQVGNFLGNTIGGLVPHFDVGSWNLPKDMLAMVHKGEMIIPADIAARIRGERGAREFTTDSPRLSTSAAVGGPTVVRIQITNHFGPSSVRSSEDIRQISREQAERVRLLGGGLSPRTNGSLG